MTCQGVNDLNFEQRLGHPSGLCPGAGKLVFAQVMEFAPWHSFRRLETKYRGDRNVRSFSCLDQFLCMAFAQLTYRESLRCVFRTKVTEVSEAT
jgi:Domain of unknown function (DUF4372)